MRFSDIENKNNQINFVKEAFTGEFTVGFELEGVTCWNHDGDFHLPSYGGYSKTNQPRGGAKFLKDYLDKAFKLEGSSGDSKIEKDGSLDTNGLGDGADLWTFEYATNKIPFNAKNLEKIYNGLTQLGDDGIYTNNSCGFHIHMSFPDMNKEDIVWIICCIACDTELLGEMFYLNTFDGEIKLFNEDYAKIDFLSDIRHALIYEENYKKVGELLSDFKYNVLHIDNYHKTIEWRGPRGFLNDDDSSIIKSFILKWFKIVSKIAKISQSTSYKIEIDEGVLTLNKYDLLKEIPLNYLSFYTKDEEEKIKKSNEYINKIIEKPIMIFSLPIKAIKNFFKIKPYEIYKEVRSLVNNDMFSEEWSDLKQEMIEELWRIYIKGNDYSETFKFCSKISKYFEENNKDPFSYITKTMDLHLKDVIFNKIFTNEIIYDEDEANLIREYFTKYDLLNTKEFKEKIRNAKNLSFRRLFRAFDPNILPGYIWNILLTPDYIFNLHYIKEIPEKYQIRIINKNPYYIQYINNPTEKVIKMAKEKVPNIKDFI